MADGADPTVDTVDSGEEFVDRLVRFGDALRDHELPVGTDDVLTFCNAIAELAPGGPHDLYWAGRSTLVHRREHLPVYDEVFRQYFLHMPAPKDGSESAPERPVPQGMTGTINVPDSEPGEEPNDEPPLVLGLQAASVEVQRNKKFSACSPDELAAVRRMISRTRLHPPLRRTRRRGPDPSGPVIDVRRMAREAMRVTDAAPELRRTDRKERARPVVLILDISGSMADHSRNLLQFAYSMRRAAQRVEVFCFGTRLTRITPALDRRNADDALRLAAERVVDWDGGTRIGESIEEFIRRWGRRGMSRGATVVICSDGLDRGNPRVLAESIERLSRLCHRIVWMNPLAADMPDGKPNTLAMVIADPFIDAIESGHDLASLEDFASRLAEIG
ncbi:MAG: VWA domain-containing protein [Actinomycetota bacterium]